MEEITGTPSQNTNPQTSGLSSADRWLLRVRGDVQVEIVDDQGRRIGPFLEREDKEEGLRVGWFRQKREDEGEEGHRLRQNQTLPSIFEVSIPGASYKPERTFTSVLLTQPGMYTCKFLGRSPSAVDIYLTGFNATTRLDTIYFHGVPISERSSAQFAYSTYDPPVNLVLTLQDEARREDIPPTAILNPRESQDTLPPRTTISLKGEQVIVSATDNPDGSGVLQTYYTTDAQTFSVYSAPFLLPAEAKIVMAFSIDRNGNREYPGAVLPVLGLSATHLVFTSTVGDQHIAPQVVYIMNLDPIPVTGPLEWLASTNIQWLTIEKKEGRTPDLMTLSVDRGNLKPGTYTGDVVVRSPTSGVVYAERIVSVVLEIRADREASSPGTIG